MIGESQPRLAATFGRKSVDKKAVKTRITKSRQHPIRTLTAAIWD
jgi:hypothetical protein